MHFLLLYLCFGLLLGIIEFISVIFIRDGEPVWLKAIYGLIVALAWPLVIVVGFLPNRILQKVRRALGG